MVTSTLDYPAVDDARGHRVISCRVPSLPADQVVAAASAAIEVDSSNAPDVEALMQAVPSLAPTPEHLAVLTSKYWGRAGVRLTVGFLDNPPADLRARILSHMNAWGITANVAFVESTTSPQVRIARTPDQGYWSYLGTDVLLIGANEATMNLDSFTMNTPDSEFYRVVRHETGHTLGFPHEHMRSEIVDRIDREKAIAEFMASQGWTREQVIAQVLTPLDNSALIATAQADPNSIMCYWLPASIMKNGTAVPGGADINVQDAQFAASIYPKFGNWQELDNNPASVAIVADGGDLYQLHNSGRIWKYTGPPFTGWQELDNNPATVAIVADGGNLYQLHNSGRIWKYTGTPLTGWQELDNNPATIKIVAAGGNLYQLHNSGRIWKYTGTPFTGWQELDNNPATVGIVADAGELYQLHNSGRIWKYTGIPFTGWQELDNNPATQKIVVTGGNLYQLHNTGAIWKYTGTPFTGWQQIDGNSASVDIVASGGNLYQIHNSGRIWKYTG